MKLEIANYTEGNLTIEQCYSSFLNLWNEYSCIIHAKVSVKTLSALQEVQEISKWDQAFMKLILGFEMV